MEQVIVENRSNGVIHHGNDAVNQMDHQSGLQERLKRKTEVEEELPAKKMKEGIEEKPCSSKTVPTAETMGITTPVDPDYSRLPKGFLLGNLAREKFAGILMADLHDRYEIQIYCRLFEHFSYYPVYKIDEDVWVSAHDHAVAEIIKFRIPPSVLMQRARAARLSAEH
uniref:Tudor domain-containing protein n=1 Tax=Caenorhabditis tropicalis TaxID=1561998 RepID=A0A1I7U0C0_9PELO